MRNTLKVLGKFIFLVFPGLLFSINANAGEFSIDCLGLKDTACANLIADIVTTKFTDKYPANEYQITLLAIQTKNGITASHSSVAPNLKASSGFSTIGTRAWVVTILAEDLSVDGLMKAKIESSRAAVRNMMEYCENTSNCDVYNNAP